MSKKTLQTPIQKRITQKDVVALSAVSPRRICFASTHKEALKRSDPPYVGKFSVPFAETFYPIFYEKTGIELFEKKEFGNFWRSIKSEKEYKKIENFIAEERNTVFLRDTLALSIALAENMKDSGVRTEIGELEYQAKYKNNRTAERQLVDICKETLKRLPFYNKASTLCAVPASDNSNNSIPRRITADVVKNMNLKDISGGISWGNSKLSLKDVSKEQKWDILCEGKLTVQSSVNIKGKDVILLDDLYQSGITMQYVAMKLQEVGVLRIFGIALVKSRTDTDNV